MQLVLPDARDLQRREQWLASQRARQLPFSQYLREHGFRGARLGVGVGADAADVDAEGAPLLPAGHADSDGGAAKHRARGAGALHRPQLYLPVSWLSGGLLCLGVVVAILVVGFVLLFISGLWQAQTAVSMAKEELMPHLDRLLNATDLIVADAQASVSRTCTWRRRRGARSRAGARRPSWRCSTRAPARRSTRRCCSAGRRCA